MELLLLLMVAVLNVPVTLASCVMNYPALVKCCPAAFKDICCASVPICENVKSNVTLTTNVPCNANDIACLPGYVRYPNGTVIPVPAGFYSLAGVRCAIPCLGGAYCPKYHLKKPVNTTLSQCISSAKQCCTNIEGEAANVLVRNISGVLVCGGYPMQICPEGFYCPDSTAKIRCANKALCPKASTSPLKCSLFNACDNDSSVSQWLYILILFLILLFILLLYLAHVYRRELASCLCTICRRSTNQVTSIKFGMDKLTMQCFGDLRSTMKMIEQLVDISFSDIVYKVNDRRILSDVFGTFRHGQLSAIMGPSGCGKTTLINILRGKIKNNVTGSISFNGVHVDNVSKYGSAIGFAPQDDIMHSTLTVKEVLTYAANIHTSRTSSSHIEVKENVSEVMTLLGISAIADGIVGNVEQRGISGGQRRRLNLAIELVRKPSILFCDEPTSGLDSSTSLELIRMLKSLAEGTGINVICVIHQPRFECFALFQKVLLLSSSGKVIYDGESDQAQSYFELLGFDTSQITNPADFVIDVANGTSVSAMCNSAKLSVLWMEKSTQTTTNVDAITVPTTQIINKGFQSEKNSNNNIITSSTDLVQEFSENAENDIFVNRELKMAPKQVWYQQFRWYYKRALVLQIRSIRQLFLELVITVLIGGILGSMYTDPDVGMETGKLAMVSLCLGMITFVSAMKYFATDWNILLREVDAGINRFSYFLAINVFILPIYLVFFPLCFLSLYYTISYTRAPFLEHFVNILCTTFATSGIAQLISTSVSEKKTYIVAVGVVLISTFVGGSNVTLCEMHKITVVGPLLTSLSFPRWYMEAQFDSEAGYYPQMLRRRMEYFARRNTYSLDNRVFCLGMNLVIGAATRILSFFAILLRTR